MTLTNNIATDRIARGIIFAVLQSIFAVLMGLCIKLAVTEHHFVDAMFYRSFVGALLLLAIIWWQGHLHRIREANLKRQLTRGILGTYGMVFTFAAFAYLPLSEVQSLLFTAPLFVIVLSYPFLGERVGPYRGTAALAGFCGVLLILQPGGISSFYGGIIGLLAATGHAGIMILLRYLGRSEDPYITALCFSCISLCLIIPFMPFYASIPSLYSLFLLVSIGVLSAGLQICLTKSYFLAPAAIIAPITYINLFWALSLDFWIWNYKPSTLILAGASIIIASNAVIIYRETRQKKTKPQ